MRRRGWLKRKMEPSPDDETGYLNADGTPMTYAQWDVWQAEHPVGPGRPIRKPELDRIACALEAIEKKL